MKVIVLATIFLLFPTIVLATYFGEGTFGAGCFGKDCPLTPTPPSGGGGGPTAIPSSPDPQSTCEANNFTWYNQTCYECRGELMNINDTLICIEIPEVTTQISIGNFIAFGIIFMVVFLFLVYDYYEHKNKKKIEKFKKEKEQESNKGFKNEG